MDASASFGAALSGNRAAASAFLDDDFQSIDRDGVERRGAAALDALEATGPATAIEDYGTVALLTRREPDAAGERVSVEAWVRRSGGWRLLVHHVNIIAAPGEAGNHPAFTPRPPEAPPARCENPCEVVPYEPRSDAERGIIGSFQTLEGYVVRNDADNWVKHMADEFIVYRTGQHPTTRDQRAANLRRQKAINAEIFVAAVETMTLWVFGDAAVMRADHVMPGNRRPPYRATRIWVNRDGRWQMTMSQQTTRAG
jgi:hypothetical protein